MGSFLLYIIQVLWLLLAPTDMLLVSLCPEKLQTLVPRISKKRISPKEDALLPRSTASEKFGSLFFPK